MSKLDRSIEAWQRGEMTDAKFHRETRDVWMRFASGILKDWKVPFAVSAEDVCQELLLHAWTAMRAWRPDGGMPCAKYVVWCALANAKTWLHAQRGASKHRRHRSLSRMPVLVEPADLEMVDDMALPDEITHEAEQWGRYPGWMRACILALVDNEGIPDAAVAASASHEVSMTFGRGPTNAMRAVRLARACIAGVAA